MAWLPWADTLVALTAVLAAYMLASSWNLPMFFLYRILLLPNQFDTCRAAMKARLHRDMADGGDRHSDAVATCATVMPHFLASSSLASSLG